MSIQGNVALYTLDSVLGLTTWKARCPFPVSKCMLEANGRTPQIAADRLVKGLRLGGCSDSVIIMHTRPHGQDPEILRYAERATTMEDA